MTTRSKLGFAIRQTFIASCLTIGCFLVGAACVLLPPAFPLGCMGIAAGLLFWVAPDLRSSSQRLPLYLLCLFIYVTLAVPMYVAIIVPNYPFISLRRFCVLLFACVTVYKFSTSAEARQDLWNGLGQIPTLKNILLAYLALQILCVLTSQVPAESINSFFQSSLNWYLPGAAAVTWVNSERRFRTVSLALVTCVLSDCMLGALETYLGSPPLWKLLPEASREYVISINPIAMMLEDGAFRGKAYRAIASFNTALCWAQMVGMVFPFALFFVVHGRNKRQKFIGCISVAACLISLLLSKSRGGYVSAMCGFTMFAMAWLIRYAYTDRKRFLGPLATVVGGVGVVGSAVAVLTVPALRIAVLGGGALESSQAGRDNEWAIAWPLIQASPLWGHGFATAGTIVNYRQFGDGPASLDDLRINLLVDTGFPGFLLFYGMLAVAIWYSLRTYLSRRSPMADYGAAVGSSILAFAIYSTKLSIPDNLPTVTIMIGLCFSMCARVKVQQRKAAKVTGGHGLRTLASVSTEASRVA